MRRFLFLLLVTAALAGCTDDGASDDHADDCDHLTGADHDACHAGATGGETGEGGDNSTAIDPAASTDITIRFTGTYPGTVTYDQSSVTVPANTTINLEFCNDDSPANPFGDHDLVVEGIEDASTSIIDGGTCETITFFSGPPKETKFFCSVGSHRGGGMEGDFIIE